MRNIHYMTSPQEWPEPPEPMLRSECCGAEVDVVGRTTLYHRCRECGRPCDVNAVEPPAPSSEDGEYERARLRSKMPEGWD